eukprot:gene10922-22799_t
MPECPIGSTVRLLMQKYTLPELGIEPRSQACEACVLTARRFGLNEIWQSDEMDSSLSEWDPANLAIGAVIHGDGFVTGLEFHKDGQYLVMTTSNSTITLIDSFTGQENKKLFTKTHGIGQVQYTHHESCILLSSERKTNDIRYLCLYDNKYIRHFKGHTTTVLSMSMSPIDDVFLSSCNDNNINLWDITMPNAVAKLQLPYTLEKPIVAYDDSGVVFGVLASEYDTKQLSLKLYDSRNYQTGPFQDIAPKSFKLPQNDNHITSFTGFEFSPDGNSILINTNSNHLMVIDGYNSETPPVIINSRFNSSNKKLGVNFTPDSQYIIAGTDTNAVHCYSRSSGDLMTTYNGHIAPIGCVRCNPKYDLLATSCINTALWMHPSTMNNTPIESRSSIVDDILDIPDSTVMKDVLSE